MLPKNFKPIANYSLVRLGKDNDGGYLINKDSIEKLNYFYHLEYVMIFF